MVDITILIIFMSGIGLGCVSMMYWMADRREDFKQAIYTDLLALRTTHELGAEAWRVREQLYQAAAEARSQGEQS